MAGDVKYPDVRVPLIGEDGNSFAILGAVQRGLTKHLREQGMSNDEIKATVDEFHREAMGGDNDHLLRTCQRWVDLG